jgi:hypothetical protein
MGTRRSIARGQSRGEALQDVGTGVELKRPGPGSCDRLTLQQDTQCDVIAFR